MVCDAELKFVDVVAKWPGSVHDARILRRSPLFEAFESNRNPVTGFMLGDSGYMLRDWLLTPLTNPRTPREMAYNYHQSSARTTVERSIGVAKKALPAQTTCRPSQGMPNNHGLPHAAQPRPVVCVT